MPHYRVLKGKHAQKEAGVVKTYKAGEDFYTDKDLSAMDHPLVGGKFERLDKPAPAVKAAAKPTVTIGSPVKK